MRISRVAFKEQTFYAAMQGDEFHCLLPPPGVPEVLPRERVEILPVVAPTKIICVGLNYRKHAEEEKLPIPPSPMFFLKPPSAIIGSGQSIQLPPGVGSVYYGGELALVIGRTASRVKPRDVPHHLFGYTCANDVVARDRQLLDPTFSCCRGYDTFCPVGPWIETDIGSLSGLTIRTKINGEIRQRGSTSDMISNPFELISSISQIMTLYAGDLILTGTPEGIGPLSPGDNVQVEIDRIGVLSNPVEELGANGSARLRSGLSETTLQ